LTYPASEHTKSVDREMKTLVRTTMTLMASGAVAFGGGWFPVGGSVEEIMAWEACQRREVDARYEQMKQRILEELEELRNQQERE
jgi:hypothetical protein